MITTEKRKTNSFDNSSKWHKDAEIYAPQTDKQDSKTTQNFEIRINMEH